MTTFVTSDFHGHHSNVCKFTKRPWTAEKNIDECVRIVNSRVEEGDTVYHLGDFSFAGTSKFDEVMTFIKRLNGKWFFLLGNHDKERMLRAAMELLPNKILGVEHYVEIGHGGKKIVMCHYPLYSWNNMKHGSIHIHGHTHAQVLDGKALDVGLDGVYDVFGEHKVLSMEEVLEFMETREISTDGSHH